MADKARSIERAQDEEKGKEKPVFIKRLVWILLVGIVPIIVTTILVGVALQFVGLPVLQTAKNVIGIGTSAPVSADLQKTKQDLADATAKERLDSSQIADLRQQVRQDQQQIAALMTQINQLQSKQNSQVSAENQAKKKAQILAQMDPTQAANVLAQMQPEEAGATVAAMTSTDSGAILGQMSPDKASKILEVAAKLQTASGAIPETNNSASGG